MIALEGDEKCLVAGGTIRDDVLKYLPLVLEAPHYPQLTEDQRNKIAEKLAYLVDHEYRAAYYVNSLVLTSTLRPGTLDAPTQLSPMVLKWAGYIKMSKYKESQQIIGNAKNGRVIRDARGL